MKGFQYKCILLLFTLILFSSVVIFPNSEFSVSHSQAKISFNTVNSIPDLQVTIQNVSIDSVNTFKVFFSVFNSLNKNISITTPDTCSPFITITYIFPDSSSPFYKDSTPVTCGQMFTTHYYAPGIHHLETFSGIGYNFLPNGAYYMQIGLRGVPNTQSMNFNVVQFTVENNVISLLSNYTSRTNLYQTTYLSLTKVSYVYNSGLVSPELFKVNFSVNTLHGQVIYPHSGYERLYPSIELELKGINSTNISPLTDYGYFQHPVLGIPNNYYNEFSFKTLPNGNYSLQLLAPGLILGNNSNIATFQLLNNTLSNLHISSLSITFPAFTVVFIPPQAPKLTNSSLITSSNSKVTSSVSNVSKVSSTFTLTSTVGFSMFFPLVVLSVLMLIKKSNH